MYAWQLAKLQHTAALAGRTRFAATRGVSMAQVALARVLRNPVISAPIVGATKPHHLTEAVAALGLRLTDDEVHELQEPYTLHGPSWF